MGMTTRLVTKPKRIASKDLAKPIMRMGFGYDLEDGYIYPLGSNLDVGYWQLLGYHGVQEFGI